MTTASPGTIFITAARTGDEAFRTATMQQFFGTAGLQSLDNEINC
jgi:hypothetical protein